MKEIIRPIFYPQKCNHIGFTKEIDFISIMVGGSIPTEFICRSYSFSLRKIRSIRRYSSQISPYRCSINSAPIDLIPEYVLDLINVYFVDE